MLRALVFAVAAALFLPIAGVEAQVPPVSFTTDAQSYALTTPGAQVTVSGLLSCAGQRIRVAFSRDSPEPLVGVVEVPVAPDGTAYAIVPPPLVAGDYVLVAFDAAAPAAPCVPGESVASSQHFTFLHDDPPYRPMIPPPPLPAGVSYTLNKLTTYAPPGDSAVVWTVSGLADCRGAVNGHLVDELGHRPLDLSASAKVGDDGAAQFQFPVSTIPPGRYYAWLGDSCSGLVMTSSLIIVAPFAETPTPTPPSTGTGGLQSGSTGNLAERALEVAGSILIAAAAAATLLARRGGPPRRL